MTDKIKIHRIGIIMNGVTGRMGTNQHLMRSMVAIIEQGGVKVGDTDVILPEPLLVGRNPDKLAERAQMSGVDRWTTDLESVLQDPHYPIYFDAQTTSRRVAALKKAINAGKHIYTEKPTATNAREAFELYRLAEASGIKHGVVQDKLWLPGFLKLRRLIDSKFFGRILSVRGEFGYWVFEGDGSEPQRPSWNYRKEQGGGIILDMFPHWSYLLEDLFGKVKSVSCLGATHINQRWDEAGQPYKCTAEDAAYATFRLSNGIIAQFNSSWTTRVHRDDLLSIQVDGTEGSALVTLRDCYIQGHSDTPRPIWNPDVPNPINFREGWSPVQNGGSYENAFKAQWELFLRYVVHDEPYDYGLQQGARGVLLAEKCLQSWAEQRWVEIVNPN